MQTVVQVICSGRTSLREAIVKDDKLADYCLQVAKQKIPGRNPGWAKIHSSDYAVVGAINLSWDGAANVLVCRFVTKGGNKPGELVGVFTSYLLARHRKRIEAINILPG